MQTNKTATIPYSYKITNSGSLHPRPQIEILRKEKKFFLFLIRKQKQKGKSFEKLKDDNKLTAFHFFFHFSHEAGVEWIEAKWVFVIDVVDDAKFGIKVFFSITTLRHLDICIIEEKKQLFDINKWSNSFYTVFTKDLGYS